MVGNAVIGTHIADCRSHVRLPIDMNESSSACPTRRRMTCELRFHGEGYGWEAQFLERGELFFSAGSPCSTSSRSMSLG